MLLCQTYFPTARGLRYASATANGGRVASSATLRCVALEHGEFLPAEDGWGDRIYTVEEEIRRGEVSQDVTNNVECKSFKLLVVSVVANSCLQ